MKIMNNETNNQNDKIFLKILQDAINSLNELDELIQSNGDRQSKVDLELSDLLHKLQNDEDLTDNNIIVLGRRIAELRKVRNSLRQEYELIQMYNQEKGKIVFANQRQWLIQNIQKKQTGLDQPYKNRVLNDEDFDTLFATPSKKKKSGYVSKSGRYSVKRTHHIVTEEEKQKIIELRKDGFHINEIAKMTGIPGSTAHAVLKKAGLTEERK